MKRKTKRTLISLILIFIGIALVAISLILTFVFNANFSFGTESFTKIIENDVKTIDISYTACKIIVEESSELKVIVKDIRSNTFDYSVENETLKIECTKKTLGAISFNNSAYIKICVPKSIKLEDININCGAGAVYINDINANSISIDCGVGLVDTNNITSSNIKIHNGIGEIKFSGEIFGDCNIDCGIGSISLKTNTEKSNFNFDISKGLGDITYKGISHAELNDFNGEYKMDIDSGIGDINLNFE